MEDDIRVKLIDVKYYFATVGMGLKWYNYEEMKQIVDLRQATTAVTRVPIRLAILLAEDAAEMGLAA